ncbi:hypothetical protein RJ641_011487 [Dillenia turbinata]|uniref:Uncharacterized protein n=1 Tax=Dillenia turbinata TaxID=194707 RepID=A0AAN8UU22_9MAGN
MCWDDYANIKFVELCEEEIRKGNRLGSYLSKDGWRNLQDNRYKKFRNNDLSLFWYQYDAIFSDIVATGYRVRAPSQTYSLNQSLKDGTDLVLDEINEGEEEYEVEDHDIEETDKSDNSQSDIQNIRGLDDTFTGDESLFPPTFNVKEKESASSGLWFYACDLFDKEEEQEIFFRQPNDELKLGVVENEEHIRQVEEDNLKWCILCQLTCNCIGAIDGSHIKAHLLRGEEIPYIGRKGWEGAAHENRILGEVIHNQNLNFLHPLEHKYYFVDASDGNKIGYLAPYKEKNIHYHLEDFHRTTRQLRQPRRIGNKHKSEAFTTPTSTSGLLYLPPKWP